MLSRRGVSIFCKNFPKIALYFVVGTSKLAIFVGQILNYVVAIILERREYGCPRKIDEGNEECNTFFLFSFLSRVLGQPRLHGYYYYCWCHVGFLAGLSHGAGRGGVRDRPCHRLSS